MAAALSAPDLRGQLMNQGVEPVGSRSPEECMRFVRAEMEKWREVIKVSGVKTEDQGM